VDERLLTVVMFNDDTLTLMVVRICLQLHF